MKPSKKFKAKDMFIGIPFLLVCVYITYFITGFVFLPNRINILEGSQHEMQFHLPIKATIESENISVLKVNHKPVDENITIDVDHSLTIESEEAGSANMTLSAFGFPIKKVMLDVVPNMEVVPCGMTVGVKISTDGVMVLGTGVVEGSDGVTHNPCEGKLKSGDLILKVNGQELADKKQLIGLVEGSESEKDVKLQIKRDSETMETTIKPVENADEKVKKLGVWVRDSTQGIGTVTYYNPTNNKFAALGHGIIDIDTKQIMVIKKGQIMESEITSIKKGKKGVPGELVGDIKESKVLGQVQENSPYGIYGTVDFPSKAKFPSEKMNISLQDRVHEGPATIRANVDKNKVEEFDVYIEAVNRYSSDDSKGMVLRITDPDLIKATNGIVQGMSGSPIIQDGKLIGAVTHVFVQEPTKGYGIFIENMLNHEK